MTKQNGLELFYSATNYITELYLILYLIPLQQIKLQAQRGRGKARDTDVQLVLQGFMQAP
jgi:hypothetical protein